MPRVIRGRLAPGDVSAVLSTALDDSKGGAVPILLVDSEGPVSSGTLGLAAPSQERDGWNKPADADDDQAYLMVQVMETWFLADRHTLQDFFGERFKANTLRQWPQLEEVPRETVFDVLEKATAGCSKPYAKGKVASELMAQIDPGLIEDACPHAKSLLARLRGFR